MSTPAKLETRPKLLEPRLAPIHELHLQTVLLHEALAKEIENNAIVNTHEYSMLLLHLGSIQAHAAHFMILTMDLRRNQPAAYEAVCDAVKEWPRP